MRRLLILAAALMLGGCNLVVSETPILTRADAVGAPQLRTGVWIRKVEGCDVDIAKPVKDWPECADVSLITADSIGEPGKDDKSMPYVLAGGTPQLLQLEMKSDDAPRLFFFVAVKPLRTDDQGRIVEARTWAVQCGPPPPPPPADASEEAAAEAEAGETPEGETPEGETLTEEQQQAAMAEAVTKMVDSMVTREPLPGLTIKDGMCMVRTVEPLRNAAEKSEAWDVPASQPLVWVRDAAD